MRGRGCPDQTQPFATRVKQNGCATGAEAIAAQCAQDLAKGVGDSSAIERVWELDVRFAGAVFVSWGTTPVVVAEGIAAHGGRLAAESVGHDVMAGLEHGLAFRRQPSTHPIRVLSAKSCNERALRARSVPNSLFSGTSIQRS
jgi:hypothetical protein